MNKADQSEKPEESEGAARIAARLTAATIGSARVVTALAACVAGLRVSVGSRIFINVGVLRGFGTGTDAVNILPVFDGVFGNRQGRIELVRKTGQAAVVQEENERLFAENIVGDGHFGRAEDFVAFLFGHDLPITGRKIDDRELAFLVGKKLGDNLPVLGESPMNPAVRDVVVFPRGNGKDAPVDNVFPLGVRLGKRDRFGCSLFGREGLSIFLRRKANARKPNGNGDRCKE